MSAVPASNASRIVDLLGFLTGTVLYLMLVAMVWRERAVEGKPLLSRRGRLPLLTGVCGLVWNIGAMAAFGVGVASGGAPPALVVALAFGALGFLPAVVVHSLLEGRETAAERRVIRPAIAAAYALSSVAAAMQLVAALEGHRMPSRPALWLLTGGFTALTALLLLVTRHQPISRRGVWVAALSVFAVSALHFGRHDQNESWWIELLGHQASLPLALAILHQDYRFALADLFLKNAIALLLLMGLSLALFSGAMVPLASWQGSSGVWDPRAIVLLIALWMATALAFSPLRRFAERVVDRVVLRRPDYDAVLTVFARALDASETEAAVIEEISTAIRSALGVTKVRPMEDLLSNADQRLAITGPELRTWVPDAAAALLLRLRTVEPPHAALLLGPLAAGRRLLSDDLRLMESMSRLAARRIDSLRVAQERVERNLREGEMQRLAAEAELRALRAQLNPHFLFNALTTIGYLIQTAPPRALETLLRLTTVLRGVLRRSTTEFSTLGEEIDLISSYLEIEHARFEDRLNVAIDVPTPIRDRTIPTLLLQPLVENAIKHGLAPRARGGAVRVTGRLEGSRLRITVSDSGVGFDPTVPRGGAGVGLRSVAERLRVHYHSLATLDIQSSEGMGTVVEITLPSDRGARAAS
jgi:two-component system LytT family sensor kinase